jgi:hypothetical protein
MKVWKIPSGEAGRKALSTCARTSSYVKTMNNRLCQKPFLVPIAYGLIYDYKSYLKTFLPLNLRSEGLTPAA